MAFKNAISLLEVLFQILKVSWKILIKKHNLNENHNHSLLYSNIGDSNSAQMHISMCLPEELPRLHLSLAIKFSGWLTISVALPRLVCVHVFFLNWLWIADLLHLFLCKNLRLGWM